MKKWLTSLLILVSFIFANKANGQFITQTYIDPCDSKVYTVLVPIASNQPKFRVGDKAIKVKGYKFPCTIVSVFQTVEGHVRVVGEMDEYGLLHIFNEDQLEKAN